MKLLTLSLAVLGTLAFATSINAQQIKLLPKDSWATDVTPDGEIVVGNYNTAESFIWRWRQDPTPTIIPGGAAVAVSDDGSVIAGNFYNGTPDNNDDLAAIWTAATGWQTLGFIPGSSPGCGGGLSSAYDISGDGTTIVGLSWGPNCSGLGYRWTAATGMVPLQSLANGHCRASAISGDGTEIGGFAQGTFSRTPAYWQPNGSGAVLNPNFQGEVYNFTENGDLSVGTVYLSGNAFSAYIRNQQTGVITDLGKLHSTNWAAAASDLSENAQTIVGFDYYVGARQAWIWTATDGIKSMKDRLTAAGVTGLPTDFWVNSACSDDGNVVVGGGFNVDKVVGYIAEFSTPSHWTDLGNGLAGTFGIPKLVGSGALTTGSATSVKLSKGKGGAPAAYVVGLGSAYAPFKQGVLVPNPDYLVSVPALSPTGLVNLAFTWPAGVPSGFSLYWQCLVSDPVAPAAVSLSNALQMTTP